MDDKEAAKLQRELKELKNEIRQLRNVVVGLVVGIIALAALLFPQLAVALLIVTALVLVGLLISPARRLVFPYLFEQKEDEKPL